MAPPSPLLAAPNVTAHPSTASVPITVLLYDGPLLCGFNWAIKGLNYTHIHASFPTRALTMDQCWSFLLDFDCIYKSLLNSPKIFEVVFDDTDEVTESILLTLQVLHTTFKQTHYHTKLDKRSK